MPLFEVVGRPWSMERVEERGVRRRNVSDLWTQLPSFVRRNQYVTIVTLLINNSLARAFLQLDQWITDFVLSLQFRGRDCRVVCTKCKLLDRGAMETSNRLALCSGKAQYVISNAPGSNTDRDTTSHEGLSLLFISFLSCNTCILGILDSSVGTVTRLRAWFPKKSFFASRKGQEIYVLLNASRPVLGCTQPPVRWVEGTRFPVVERLEREA